MLLSLGWFKGLKGSSTLPVNLAVKGSGRGQLRAQACGDVLDTAGNSSVRVKCWWKQAMRSNTGCAVRPAGYRTRPHLYNTRLSTTHTHTHTHTHSRLQCSALWRNGHKTQIGCKSESPTGLKPTGNALPKEAAVWPHCQRSGPQCHETAAETAQSI